MKLLKNFTFLFLICFSTNALAQFEGFNYQGVARDNSGSVIANSSISLRLSILDGSVSGISEYIETHNLTTNQFGLFALVVGKGTTVSGTFSNVGWGAGKKFLKVELDINGGTNYSFIGTNELITVPFALYAQNSGNGQSNTYSGGTGIDITNNVISNTAPDQTVSITALGPTTVTGLYPNFVINSVDSVNDADSDPTNEIQTISQNGNTITLSNNGGSVTVANGTTYAAGSGININSNTISAVDASISNELQTLSINGNNLSISNGNTVLLPTGITYTAGSGINISGNAISAVDASPTNEIQTLSKSGNAILLSNSGGSITGGSNVSITGTGSNLAINVTGGITYTAGSGVNISGNTISNTGDLSATNELQTLSVSGNNITISNGNTIALPVSNSIVVVNATNLTSVTVANNDIIKIDGTITLSVNYTKFDFSGLTIHGGIISGTGTQLVEIGSRVTFVGTKFQNIKVDGYETAFYHCEFSGAIALDGARNKFNDCNFFNTTISSIYGSPQIEFNQCAIENSTINAGVKVCVNSKINNVTFASMSFLTFTNNEVDYSTLNIIGKGRVVGNSMDNCRINCANTIFGMLLISDNTMDDPLSGMSDLVNVDVSGSGYRIIKITNNIMSCNNASGGGTTNSTIKTTGNFTGSYCTVEMSNNHFDRGNKAIDNTATGSYKFIIKDNTHKNLGTFGVTNGGNLIVSDNIQL